MTRLLLAGVAVGALVAAPALAGGATNCEPVSEVTGQVVFQGLSHQPQHSPDGQGTSGITRTTTTTFMRKDGRCKPVDTEVGYDVFLPGGQITPAEERIIERADEVFD